MATNKSNIVIDYSKIYTSEQFKVINKEQYETFYMASIHYSDKAIKYNNHGFLSTELVLNIANDTVRVYYGNFSNIEKEFLRANIVFADSNKFIIALLTQLQKLLKSTPTNPVEFLQKMDEMTGADLKT